MAGKSLRLHSGRAVMVMISAVVETIKNLGFLGGINGAKYQQGP